MSASLIASRSCRRLGLGLARVFVVVGAVAAACSGGSDSDVPTPPASYGPRDEPANADVAVDESALSADIDGGTLTVEVPIAALGDEIVSGELVVRLLTVDGEEELARGTAGYDLAPAESTRVPVELAVPEEIELQDDLVDYVVRVETPEAPAEEGAPGEAERGVVRVTKSLFHMIPAYRVELEGPARVQEGRPASYRLKASDPRTRQPLAEQELELSVDRDGEVTTQTVITLETGDAVVEIDGGAPGEVVLLTRMHGHGTHSDTGGKTTVEAAGKKLLLTTDKPIYQPGQLVHLRALGLGRGDRRPLAGHDVLFEISDGKGNKVMKKTLETDDFGVAWTDFRIGQIVNEGTYTAKLSVGEVSTQKTFEVFHYALPKFEVGVKTQRPWYRPSDEVVGSVDARYFFGKTVGGGQVEVQALTLDVGETIFARVLGELDAEGHYEFAVDLPEALVGQAVAGGNALVSLRITVTDTAGQIVQKTVSFPVAQGGAQLTLVPEGTELVPGLPNDLLLFVTDPLGGPVARAEVTLVAPNGEELSARTDRYGQARVTWTPPFGGTGYFTATLTTEDGEQIVQSASLRMRVGQEQVVVRTDKSVYELGESVEVRIVSTDPEANVYVDWLNDGQPVDMRTLGVEDGQASFLMPIDTTLLGESRIEAYVVDSGGNIARSGRTIFARGESALKVEVETDRADYEPGDEAELTFNVTDEAGRPAVAALGVQIVDQAVYALVDAQPGLLRTYFELDDAFAQPAYEIHGPNVDFSRLFFVDTATDDAEDQAAAQQASAGALAALGASPVMGLRSESYGVVQTAVSQRLAALYAETAPDLVPVLQDGVQNAIRELEDRGCTPVRTMCGTLGNFDAALRQLLDKTLSLADFWGSPWAFGSFSIYTGAFSLRSSGPDEIAGNQDDGTVTVTLAALDFERTPPGIPIGSGTGGFAGGAANPGGMGGPVATPADPNTPVIEPEPGGNLSDIDDGTSDAGERSDEPRVRRDFPETLLVNPSVITGADGRATLRVPMADSITEWRVSTLASTIEGKLGGGESGVTVFQDFFVDVDFPAELTRGDEVTFPIAVYSYLDAEQTVSIELEAADWYTPLGETSASLTLEPGEVRGLSFPVRVNEVGLKALMVRAIGSERSDAVERSVRVVPDGKAFPSTASGALAPGEVTHAVDFPEDAIVGSEALYVDVFPAFLSQVVAGMDSMLRTPNGCFEQTTSTAWPNVLVTEYMRETNQVTPEIELKAESLMNAGYQRLLTFEHPGGGFSWFGTTDGAPYLSVTAFGLMEFSDMARVHMVDEVMIARTVAWLVSQQASDGSWAGDMSEFFSFHTSLVRNTAFVAWALASAGYQGPALDNGLGFVEQNLGDDQDAYTLGVVANAFALGAPNSPFLDGVIAKLAEQAKTEDERTFWDSGNTQTQFYGGGMDANVSTTALVVHALLILRSNTGLVDGGLEYLLGQKDANGNFGSTQATIWALRTLLLAAKSGAEGAVGTAQVFVDGELAREVVLTEDQSDVMTRVDLSTLASPGAHQVRLSFEGEGQLSYGVVASHHLPWEAAPAPPEGPLGISVTYDKQSLAVDETVTATVAVSNNTDAVQNMILLTLGIPPGFEVMTDDLVLARNAGRLSHFELTARQLNLYVSTLAAGVTETYTYRLRAIIPVQASDGGAEASLYYEPAIKVASAAQVVTSLE